MGKSMTKKIISLVAAFLMTLAAAQPASAQYAHGVYTYIQNEAEYSIQLPDAPTGQTLWADGKYVIPFLDAPPKFGSVGEIATLTRVDPDTGDTFDVKITFLKAERDFLISLTKEKMMAAITDALKDVQLDQREEHFSGGSDTLKWATVTGFSADQSNALHFNAVHYLVGLSSIMVVQVSYSVENRLYQSWYDTMSKSIKYAGLR